MTGSSGVAYRQELEMCFESRFEGVQAGGIANSSRNIVPDLYRLRLRLDVVAVANQSL